METLSRDIHGDHWQVLRSLLPLYQAITVVDLGDGKTCCFWSNVWMGNDALADVYPALYSHCTKKDASVFELVSAGLQHTLVPRLSLQASTELPLLLATIDSVVLQPTLDKRLCLFAKGEAGIDSGALYRLLKARGQPEDQHASFI